MTPPGTQSGEDVRRKNMHLDELLDEAEGRGNEGLGLNELPEYLLSSEPEQDVDCTDRCQNAEHKHDPEQDR